ncbi:MAG: hypothetical protein LBB60_11110 [Desulfovibrio sp.]|nr:hypothetical protein [Desulfovibrio sp.]
MLSALLRCMLVMLAVALPSACARHAARPDAPAPQAGASDPEKRLPRIDPAYIQWLERQSMLGMAPQLASQVSGTEIIWHNSAKAQRLSVLLDAAPNWFYLNPYATASSQPLFRTLAAQGFADFLSRTGFNGLFIAPANERGDIWQKPDNATGDGENITSLKFDPVLGDDEDFARLSERMEQAQIQMGGNLPPAATGLGPDFMLQARRAARFDGIYAMISVPQKNWDLLPRASDEWECRPLQAETVAALARLDLLPESLRRDALPWAAPGGWASTGEVRGSDGRTRRWVYRYSRSVLRPVLLWQDPSAQARRIFSAAVIRHTGLQRQTLTGLKLEALMGLDVGEYADEAQSAGRQELSSLTPGLEALDEVTREIHRYGGWAIQSDALPDHLTPAVLAAGIDVTRDAATPALVAHALRTRDAGPLRRHLRSSLAAQVNHSRLARGMGDREDEDHPSPEARLLALGWRIGLPGLCFISLEPAAALSPEKSAAPDILPPLARLLQSRKQAGLAGGKLLAVLSGPPGCIAAISALPDGGFWLLASNFSDRERLFSITLPPGAATGMARDAVNGQLFEGRSFEIALDARQARHIVFIGQQKGAAQ